MSGGVIDRLREVLGEADRKEVGRSTEVALEILDNPAILPDLIACLRDGDEAVVSHAAHAVMQISAQKSSLFQTFADGLVETLANKSQWEIGEQLPKILCELDLSEQQLERLVPLLMDQTDDRSAIAAASALSALRRLADRGSIPRDIFDRAIEKALVSPRKAVAARARRLLA